MDKQGILNIVKYRTELAYDTIKESESHLANGFLNTAITQIDDYRRCGITLNVMQPHSGGYPKASCYH